MEQEKISARIPPRRPEDRRSWGLARLGRRAGRVVIQATGLLLAGFMAIATLYEINANDFFGTSVCMLVVVFGMQLMSIGSRQAGREAEEADKSDPLRKLWASSDRSYPISALSRNSGRGLGRNRSR